MRQHGIWSNWCWLKHENISKFWLHRPLLYYSCFLCWSNYSIKHWQRTRLWLWLFTKEQSTDIIQLYNVISCSPRFWFGFSFQIIKWDHLRKCFQYPCRKFARQWYRPQLIFLSYSCQRLDMEPECIVEQVLISDPYVQLAFCVLYFLIFVVHNSSFILFPILPHICGT